jgi:hypothetical protein
MDRVAQYGRPTPSGKTGRVERGVMSICETMAKKTPVGVARVLPDVLGGLEARDQRIVRDEAERNHGLYISSIVGVKARELADYYIHDISSGSPDAHLWLTEVGSATEATPKRNDARSTEAPKPRGEGPI